MKGMNSGKAREDSLTIKDTVDFILSKLTQIYIRFFITNSVPRAWKNATIINRKKRAMYKRSEEQLTNQFALINFSQTELVQYH